MTTRKKATLVLQNGRKMEGWSFGYDGPCDGEVVFSTAMVGYPESLTDPSYSGQILCVTYPLIGNYGIPPMEVDADGICKTFESEKIWVRGLIISDYSEKYSTGMRSRASANGCRSRRSPVSAASTPARSPR